MGKLSNKKRSAQRPGKHERARVKKPYKGKMILIARVAGAGNVHIMAGRKKLGKACRAVSQLTGDSIIQNAIVSIQWPACRIDTSASKEVM